jgi:RNA polymerase sigma factor (TIGR02999 family)
MPELTLILSQLEAGDPSAADRLLPLVYEELRQLAAARLAQEQPGQTLQATALVHEAYVRLLKDFEPRTWDSRGHFFAAAAEAMRRILVDAARRKRRVKHGGARKRVELTEDLLVGELLPEQLLDLGSALSQLASDDPNAARLVQLHFFAGLTLAEAGEALQISPATAKRYWRYARACLRQALERDAID